MDEYISNINKITWIRPYNSKKGPQKKHKDKKRKKTDTINAQDEDNIIGNKLEDVENVDSENDNYGGHNLDINI